jgi:hypothetical protein
MTSARHEAWTEENTQATLAQLREQFPRYSENELYAIWCHLQRLVPFGRDGKVNITQWLMHAAEDGKHVREGGFRVSRPMYGKAIRAKSGTAKPRLNRRTKREIAAAEAGVVSETSALSKRALEFARQYDEASSVLNALLHKRREMRQLADQLRRHPKGALLELSGASDEAGEALREGGLL